MSVVYKCVCYSDSIILSYFILSYFIIKSFFIPPVPPSLPQKQEPPVAPQAISQSAQPSTLPKPVPTTATTAAPTTTNHVASSPSDDVCPPSPGRGKTAKFLSPEEMTSRDYYFDSYAHFGIHEVGRPPIAPVPIP